MFFMLKNNSLTKTMLIINIVETPDIKVNQNKAFYSALLLFFRIDYP